MKGRRQQSLLLPFLLFCTLMLFVPRRHLPHRMMMARAFSVIAPIPHSRSRSLLVPPTKTTRLYATSNRKDEGFFSKLKSLVPFWKDTKEDSSKPEIVTRQTEKQRQQADMEKGIQTLFKDAPLPVRMLGGVMTRMVSSIVQEAADQQASVQDQVEQATRCIQNDRRVQQALQGTTVQVGPPFSQSSSTTSINGKSQTTLAVAMPVNGGQAIARLSVQTPGESKCVVEIVRTGERIVVDMNNNNNNAYASSAGNVFGGTSVDDTIVEAEIVDKRTKRP